MFVKKLGLEFCFSVGSLSSFGIKVILAFISESGSTPSLNLFEELAEYW